MTPRELLEQTFAQAKQTDEAPDALTEAQRENVRAIVQGAESQKAVLAVLMTSLVKKMTAPEQDIRQHKIEQVGGYSGRSFDTNYVTPFLRENFARLAMRSGSGWLTRSIEQNYPFTRDFPGKIQNAIMKKALLEILHDLEENGADPKNYLLALLAELQSVFAVPALIFAEESANAELTITEIMELLRAHFFFRYQGHGASRLPALAIYAIYEALLNYHRYEGKTLAPLKAHTTSDARSRSYGDVEILTEDGALFEGIEIKHNIRITPTLIADAYEKFRPTLVNRFYLLTTAEPNIEPGKESEIAALIARIRREHGCEVIVNGLLPSLKYYLRLLPDPPAFVANYTRVLQADYQQSADIKTAHLAKWNELLAAAQQVETV